MSFDDDFDDFIEFLEDLDNPLGPTRPPKKQKTYSCKVCKPRFPRPQNPFEKLDELEFLKRYRLSKRVFLFVLHKINKSLEYGSERNCGVCPAVQLMVALHFYATGNHLLNVGEIHGVHNSTVSRIVRRVSHALVGLQQEFIKFPSSEKDIRTCQRHFYEIAHFPFVIGAIDCTHVKIQSPGGTHSKLFRNSKGYFSVNVQTVSDAECRILNVVAHWPGSTHDSDIFADSNLCHEFESGWYGNSCLLGHSGYPLKQYLLTPYRNPKTLEEENYNSSHIKTRYTTESQYDILKRRFPVLAHGLRIRLETAIEVIISCCILHNICIKFRENVPSDQLNQELDKLIKDGQINHQPNDANDDRGIDMRASLTHEYFTNNSSLSLVQ